MQGEKVRLIVAIVKAILFLVPALFGFHQWAYNKLPKYYFLITKLFNKWRDTKWSIVASYDVSKDDDFFGKFEGVLRKQFKDFNRIFNLKNKKQYEFGDFSLVVQYDMDVSCTNIVRIELLFNRMNVTYKNAGTKLKELRTLFNELEKTIKFHSNSYSMDIFFTTVKNPFYGLMIQRLGEEHVKEFECLFPISVLEKKETGNIVSDDYYLRVFKDKITVNESDFNNVEEIASKCLLLR